MKQRIALDMDDVMADSLGRAIEWYERDFGITIDQDEMAGKFLRQMVLSEHIDHVRQYLFTEGYFRNLKVKEGCKEILPLLLEKYEVFIVTAAMEFPNSFNEKYEWLVEHFPYLHWKNFVFCGDKSIIKADYMIDDHVRNLVSFTGKGILFTAPYNVDEERFTRVNNWQQIGELLLQ